MLVQPSASAGGAWCSGAASESPRLPADALDPSPHGPRWRHRCDRENTMPSIRFACASRTRWRSAARCAAVMGCCCRNRKIQPQDDRRFRKPLAERATILRSAQSAHAPTQGDRQVREGNIEGSRVHGVHTPGYQGIALAAACAGGGVRMKPPIIWLVISSSRGALRLQARATVARRAAYVYSNGGPPLASSHPISHTSRGAWADGHQHCGPHRAGDRSRRSNMGHRKRPFAGDWKSAMRPRSALVPDQSSSRIVRPSASACASAAMPAAATSQRPVTATRTGIPVLMTRPSAPCSDTRRPVNTVQKNQYARISKMRAWSRPFVAVTVTRSAETSPDGFTLCTRRRW